MARKRRSMPGDRLKQRKSYSAKRYTEKTLREDREYGFYWYAWLWHMLRPVLIFLCALIIVVGLVSTAWTKLYEEFLMPPEPNNPNTYAFEIQQGESLSSISKNLQKANLVRSSSIFKYVVQFTSTASDIRYGTYYLSPSMEISDIVHELTSNVTTTERTITIIPGWTVENVAEYLVDVGALENTDEFLSLCNQPEKFIDYCYPLREAYENGTLTGRKYALEGYLAPDTYRVFSTASAESIIQRLVSQTNTVVDGVYYSDTNSELSEDQAAMTNADGTITTVDEDGNEITVVPTPAPTTGTFKTTLSMDETLILASIIEREAGTTSDYAKVSAVFHNRLLRSWNLDSDATISYALGINRLNLSDEELSTNSAYNTYQNSGLPVGPICNPSKAALSAALHPDEEFMNDGYMYFCSGDPEKNELIFAHTEAEHSANVSQYRQLWIDFDARQEQRDNATNADGDNAAAP